MMSAPATIGVAALVPTTCTHCPPQTSRMPSVPSAAAETSASIRFEQLVYDDCQEGFAIAALQPLPVAWPPLFQTVSAQPREDVDWTRFVPPTAMTPADVAGYSAP
jgi:hypothetical protein